MQEVKITRLLQGIKKGHTHLTGVTFSTERR